jgi:hypothetical protein
VGQGKRPFAQSGAVPGSGCAELGDMAERISAFVAIGSRIWCSANAERIQNEKKGTRHFTPEREPIAGLWNVGGG